jgi:hypothetical protein
MVKRLIANPEFFRSFPEFRVLRQVKPVPNPNCKKCETAKAESVRIAGFTSILKSLKEPRLKALKSHLGVKSITLRALNRVSGEYEPRII